MQHITYRPIDRQFRCLERDLPPGAPFNRVDPIDGIAFGFALESRFPEEVYFGTVAGKVADDPAIELRAISDAEYDADEAAELEARKPTPEVIVSIGERIDAERDRRIAAGITFADHPFQTSELDRERINTSRISALSALLGGVQKGDYRWHGLPVDFFWIAADNARVKMDAQTMVAFGNAVAARQGLLIVAGNDLKARIAAGEAIPDITEDSLWPA